VYTSGFGTLTGTSAATPTWAGIISLLNSQRAEASKPPLGFLNQDLYNINTAGIGTDVLSGDNKNGQCDAGFKAASGWDPITGLGVPDYPTLSSHLLNV
jgi:tripeptidyl-peptidase-1